jgi:hypothetical protein
VTLVVEPSDDLLASAALALRLPTPKRPTNKTRGLPRTPNARKVITRKLAGMTVHEIGNRLHINYQSVYGVLWRYGGRAIGRHFWISEVNLKRLGITPRRALKLGAVPSNGGFFAHVPRA